MYYQQIKRCPLASWKGFSSRDRFGSESQTVSAPAGVSRAGADPALEEADRRIGEAAGAIWSCLRAHGEVSFPAMRKRTGLPADVLHRALGWLAREAKVSLSIDNGVEKIRLR